MEGIERIIQCLEKYFNNNNDVAIDMENGLIFINIYSITRYNYG